MFKHAMIATALSGLTLLGCAVEQDPMNEPPGQTPPGEIDQAMLAEYRAALPTMGQLQASAPESTAEFTTAAVGDPAFFPSTSYDIVLGINTAVSGIIDVLDQVTSLPPTIFNSDTQEFFWGPFPNDDGIGYVAAYIRDAGEEADFRFEYALLRGIDNDVANLTPVIWGGASPDAENEDHGVGITLWDFEANRAFEAEHNPDFDQLVLDRGRFIALYAAGPDEQDPNAEVAFVVAAFRNFVPSDNPNAESADLDYLYGRYEGDITLDFVDYETSFDVDEPGDGLIEDVGVRLAFLNEGTGRAEVDVRGGSLADDERGLATECWNAALRQRFLSIEIFSGDTSIAIDEEGDVADCGLFTSSLSELDIPSLDDIDPELRAALDNAAENGIAAE
ncbi:hypothetical protein [Haliangium sp.]|uniref:hypothetical protein n=1 Tax=Haliangium sp. TaxID=2663208 RepID=UPI003D1321B5